MMARVNDVRPPLRRVPTPGVSSDEESVYVDRKTGVTYNFSIIPPMEWGTEGRHTYIDWWKWRIGDAPGLLRANDDVHLFILSRLFALLSSKKTRVTGDGGLSPLENQIVCEAGPTSMDNQVTHSVEKWDRRRFGKRVGGPAS